MRILLVALALCAMIVSATGCVYVTATRGQQGKAYVVKATPLGSSFWNCDASSGKPKCYKVIKQ
jgi:hypothetical protein